MAVRNLAIEKNAVDSFIKQRGAKPSTDQDWAVVYRMSYPTDLPEELKSTTAASLYAAGQKQPTAATPLPAQSLDQLRGNVAAREQDVANYSSPRTAMSVLQDAIKAKTQFQKESIGPSTLFEAAGVTGMPTLAASLSQRGSELSYTADQYRDIISSMAGQYKDMATAAADRYKASVDAYNAESTRLSKIEEEAKAHQRQLEILKMQDQLQKERIMLEKQYPSITEQINAFNLGGEVINGKFVPAGAGTVTANGQSFNISRYATDPNHERAVASILSNIGKFNTVEEIDAYIKRKYPNSPITGAMVAATSEKTNTPWEVLVAMMEQDSSMGTKGKGARTFNPGNVGNDDSGNLRNYGSWQAGVDAVGEWLNRNRVATTATQGLSPTAQAVKNGIIAIDKLPEQQRLAVAAELAKSGQGTPAQEGVKNQLSDAIGIIDALSKHSGLSGAVGAKGPSSAFGYFEKPIGGTAAAGFIAQLDRLKALVTIPMLQSFKGLGAMSDKEFQTAQSAVSALNRDMPEAEFNKELNRLKEALSGSASRLGVSAMSVSEDDIFDSVMSPSTPSATEIYLQRIK